MSEKNFFTVNRSLFDSFLWEDKPFSKGQAWVDLFGKANHADGEINIRGTWVTIKRGQSGRSELTFSKDWGWSRGKVRRFLSLLQSRGMIELKQDNKTTITTICNYERFQLEKKDSSTANSTADGTPNEHQTNTKQDTNKKKENKNKNKKEILKPENVSDQTWEDFLIHRKSKKASVTQTVINSFSKESKLAGISLEEAFIESSSRGWVGFKAEWMKDKSAKTVKTKEKELSSFERLSQKMNQAPEPEFQPQIKQIN